MKRISFYFALILLLSSNLHCATAQNLESQMRAFFSFNNNQAYWWLSKFAHPMNTFRSGYCEMTGNYVDVTIKSIKHTTRIRLHKNGAIFDSIETLADTDWAEAFVASNVGKDLLISFWRDYSSDTVNRIENIFGNLNNIDSKQMCLAVLSVLLWKYPSNSSVSSSNNANGRYNINLSGRIDKYPITMSLIINGQYVKGSYYYHSQGSNKVLKLSGVIEDGAMILYETDEYGLNTGHFQGFYSDGVYEGLFISEQGKKYQFRVSN